MKGKLSTALSLLFVLVLMASPLGALSTWAAPKPPDYNPVLLGPDFREKYIGPSDIVGIPEAGESAAETAQVSGTSLEACTIDTKFMLTYDDFNGRLIVDEYLLVGESALTEVWVQANLSFPANDPRPTPVITCEQVAYLIDEFDNNIYPTEIAFFGTPNFHDGSNAILDDILGLPSDYYYNPDGRQIVMVSNIRDDNYYNPSFPNYIAGFYWGLYEQYFDRNIMNIDAYDWENRVGDDAARPNLYEGVFAHEYQHLLHDDYDPDEESWINEGMADLAEFLVGYGHPDSHVVDITNRPENSLVAWGDQGPLEILADYGIAYLFQLYLMEQYGQSFIQALFHNPENSITSVESTLAAFNSRRNYEEVFRDFSIALVVDAYKGGKYYEFKNIDIAINLGTPDNPNTEAFATPGAPPWGTDYVWITGDLKEVHSLVFNGVDYFIFPTSWSSDGEVLWGGEGDLIDNWAIFPATGGGTLTFDTMYEIEEFWDFGFVQVSTDGGVTWTSLENEYTTTEHDPSAHPKVVENLPGLTGSSGGWVTMSFDLSAYAGQDILIGFRYVTDWASNEAGWFIDNIYYDGDLISDGSSKDPFQDLTEIIPINNDFSVTFLGMKGSPKNPQLLVLPLELDDMTEDGAIRLHRLLSSSNQALMLVTYKAPEGFNRYTDYSYEIVYREKGPRKK